MIYLPTKTQVLYMCIGGITGISFSSWVWKYNISKKAIPIMHTQYPISYKAHKMAYNMEQAGIKDSWGAARCIALNEYLNDCEEFKKLKDNKNNTLTCKYGGSPLHAELDFYVRQDVSHPIINL